MEITIKGSFGGLPVTIDQRGREVPVLTVGNKFLEEGVDYTIEEKDVKHIGKIVFEGMVTQSVYLPRD